ncbi:O-antigen ligase family protein [Geodermatophilus sp. SYSU D00766]
MFAVGLYAVTLFVFPSNLVIGVLGGQGFVAGLVALTLFGWWVVSTLLGSHDPVAVRHPTRGVLVYLAVMSLISWALTPFHGLTVTQQLGADRWLVMLAQYAGVVLVAAEGLSRRGLMTVLRLTVLGAAFCAFVAVLQLLLDVDLSGIIRGSLPGFSVDLSHDVYEDRGALQRVFGTSAHPIELGVISGMLLPVAIVVAMQDRSRSALRRWVPVLLIALAIPASVSRSAVLTAVVSSAVLILCLPPRPRLTALVIIPLGTFVVGLMRPGYFRTLADLVGAGSADTSVSGRLADVPLVQRLVAEHPWFGFGGGTYVPGNALDILDNQYFKSAIELGLVGLTGLLAWLLLPVLIGIDARRRSGDPGLRAVAGALTGAALASAVASYTFDGLAFNMYGGLHALVVGCIGTCWLLARAERRQASSDTARPGDSALLRGS